MDQPHAVEPDRGNAIHLAIGEAGPQDVILIAGKGHESSQEIAGKRLPFSDAAVAREALRRRSGT
jgi:UDP-N-acetylmuramoyl-L-alanyl-D-glutamate--2,6-diaminopimelate ligase